MDIDKKRKILKAVLVIMICGAIVSAIGVITTAMQYQRSINAYNKLEGYVSLTADATAPTPAPAVSSDESEPAPTPESQIKVDIEMDFDSLKAINPDVVGWIYYEPLELSYPVVMDKGNNYYENYTFENEKNVAGAIFLDYACNANFEGFNSIVYGHNMRNGTMFGSLKQLVSDPSIIEPTPYFYIFTEKNAMMYKIVSTYYTSSKSQTYDMKLDYTTEDMKAYIDYIASVSTYKDEEFFKEPVSEDMKMVTLSTCHGLHSGQRTVVHGILVAQEER